ncbi:MAG: dihydroorotate dehydrogenase electron transfer subunit [Clostridiales bacterium]|nr:dihydroorotate dehydrogenase electron transfer subunit [Clostridiales bacterium]
MEVSKIIKNQEIAPGMMDMWILNESVAKGAVPGQFLSLYCEEESRLLPRPISICEVRKETKEVRLVYRIVGDGTCEFGAKREGDTIRVMGPLGNGFSIQKAPAILVGGGVGIPPLLELAKAMKMSNEVSSITIVLGYRDQNLFLKNEFEAYGKVLVATEDGSVGYHGNVMQALLDMDCTNSVLYACGPKPMLAALASFAKDQGISAQVSMEERMACGIGACLACVCKTKDKDHHTKVNNTRVCKEGPVFDSETIDWER